jgi:putative transposase
LATAAGWVYLAAVVDLFSRKVVGWSIGASLATELVSDALRNAIERRRPDGKRLLHHSDRGCQYTSDAYQKTLKLLGITCSMSRRGCCYDNAVMERFFWSLSRRGRNTALAKLETLHERLRIMRHLQSNRLHETLDYRSPDSN